MSRHRQEMIGMFGCGADVPVCRFSGLTGRKSPTPPVAYRCSEGADRRVNLGRAGKMDQNFSAPFWSRNGRILDALSSTYKKCPKIIHLFLIKKRVKG